jgi:hypothetical protein
VKRTLIIAAVILSTVVFALPASAENIDSFIDGPWLRFKFLESGSYATGGCTAETGCEPMVETNYVYVELGDSPWEIRLDGAALFRITDAFMKGDTYAVYDNGVEKPILETPGVAEFSMFLPGFDNPEFCYEDPSFSHGAIVLAPGEHSLTIQVLYSPFGYGDAYFRIDRIVAAPEPLSIMLLGSGLLGLVAIRRSRG